MPTILKRSIIVLHSESSPGSLVIRSSVAPVTALIGLKQTLPHSFNQMFQRILSRTGAFYAGFIERFAQCHHSGGVTAIRFSDDQPIELLMQNNAGFHDLTRGLDDAADRALWPDELPLTPRRVNGL